MSRYNNRRKTTNRESSYMRVFRERGVKYISQYVTPRLHHPTVEQAGSIQRISHVWKTGDSFYKLAHKYYGDSKLWWVIAWYNQTPTEHHVAVGRKIKIPTPVDTTISILLQEP